MQRLQIFWSSLIGTKLKQIGVWRNVGKRRSLPRCCGLLNVRELGHAVASRQIPSGYVGYSAKSKSTNTRAASYVQMRAVFGREKRVCRCGIESVFPQIEDETIRTIRCELLLD